ncbi:hypothetical protein K7432_003427 [Basidiobolus ranarum]|uniref:WW domain-containing protein n=1 Tax=Basidiobolus ranarum TaxID=34480 RepID=A0ABR2W658_9FUNG
MRPENRGFPPNRARTFNNRQRENLTGSNSEEIAVRRPRFRNDQQNQHSSNRDFNETNYFPQNSERGRPRCAPSNFQNRREIDFNKTKQPERDYNRNRRGRGSQNYRGDDRRNNYSTNNRRYETKERPRDVEDNLPHNETTKKVESLHLKENTPVEPDPEKPNDAHEGKEINTKQHEKAQVYENVQHKHSTKDESHSNLKVSAFDEPEDVISFHADEEDEMLLYGDDSDDEEIESSSHTPSNTNSHSDETNQLSVKNPNGVKSTTEKEPTVVENKPKSALVSEKKCQRENIKEDLKETTVKETVVSHKEDTTLTKRSSSRDSNQSHKRSRTSSPIPQPWTKVYSSKGELYFYNPDTNESRWTIPEFKPADQHERQAKHDLCTPSDSLKRSPTSRDYDWERRSNRHRGGDSWRPEERKANDLADLHRNSGDNSAIKEEKGKFSDTKAQTIWSDRIASKLVYSDFWKSPLLAG